MLLDLNKRTLWLDYDDTLGGVLINGKVSPGHRAYFDCIDRFVAFLNGLGLDGERARTLQHDIDVVMAKQYGFGDKTRFARSMVEAYLQVSFEQTPYHAPKWTPDIHSIGMSVFTDYPYVPLEGALDVLRSLAPEWNLVVVTKGVEDEQGKKLAASGVGALVDGVICMDHKSEQEWVEKVFAPLGFSTAHDLRHTVAVGNSVKSDVNPPLKLGTNGVILLDHGNWTFEKADAVDPLPARTLSTIEDIRDLPAAIAAL